MYSYYLCTSNCKIIFITSRVDSKKHKVVASLYIPELRMKGNYNLKGQLFMLPIEGDGIFHAKYGTSFFLLHYYKYAIHNFVDIT